MNIPESAPHDPASPGEDIKQLHDAITRSQRQMQAGFGAVILLALAINLYLYKEQSTVQQQLRELEQVVKNENEYLTRSVPQMNAILAKFQEYAKTHPDFRPIIENHFPNARKQAPAPATMPAPKGKP